jgi:hypothetical protein
MHCDQPTGPGCWDNRRACLLDLESCHLVMGRDVSNCAVLHFCWLQASCLLSACSLHDVLTGVTFCGTDNNDVAAVAYDADALMMWRAGSTES